MIKSEEVISCIKKLNPKNYVSIFTVGSIPKILIPKSDLDIIFVIKAEKKNEFFKI